MLKKLLNLLSKDLTGLTWTEESVHPYFGEILLFVFRDSDKSYWEAELEFEGEKVGVGIDAPEKSEPTQSQVNFAKNILDHPDLAFAKAKAILIPEYESWHKERFPDEWRAVFKLAGFTIPVGGDENQAWELSYDSLKDPNRHQFTCYFEGGKPSHASVDG